MCIRDSFIIGPSIVLLTATPPGVVSGVTPVIVAMTSWWATVCVCMSHVWTSSPSIGSGMHIVDSAIRSVLLIVIIVQVLIMIVITLVIHPARRIGWAIRPVIGVIGAAWSVVIVVCIIVVVIAWVWPKKLSSVVIVVVTVIAVSYTHLDVYKRQMLLCLQR